MKKASKAPFSFLPALVLCLSACLSEPPAFLLMALGAVIAHEMGHLFLFLLLTKEAPTLEAEGFGLRLCALRPLLPREELLITLAGPLSNILLGILLCRIGEWGLFFGSLHFLFGLFNLLPLGMSDGERLLRLFLGLFFSNARREVILLTTRAILSVFFFSFASYLYYYTGMGLCGVLYAAAAFPWREMFSAGHFVENGRKTENLEEKRRF